ncbi:lytic transglycosylase [Streptomyces sp. NPDC059008]|uniref:lytic transglycosylase domain-containing protein n=1 Tax=Streptomyces sp. NPDC059008 TaxID=3346693 RepID=UPI0036A64ED9
MAATFRRRLVRGAASTAVAALVLAALTASQAPAATESTAAGESGPTPPPADTPIDGGSAYYTDLPPLNSPVPPSGSHRPKDGPVVTGPAQAGIPATVLAAYKKAESRIDGSDPGCRLPWQLLAGIGKVESGQARGGAVDAEGTTLQPILGPQLNGHGFARITDTDGGRYDGDLTHDRAVGPMQFIPSTWSSGGHDGGGWGADGNGDGKKDPNNVFDAALAAGHYLCAAGRDLSTPQDLDRAILGYNNSEEYLRTVLSWYAFYRTGTYEVPDGKGVLPVQRGGNGAHGGDRTEGRTGKGHGRGTGAGHHPGKLEPHGPGKPEPDGPAAPKPHGPAKPDKPAEPGGTDSAPGGTDPHKPGPKPPTEPAPLTALVRVGDKDVSATAGTEFAASPRVRAEDAAGKPVAGAPVRFTLPAASGARFPDGATAVTVTTGKDGLATAPTLHAGDKAGAFTIRATAVARTVPAVAFGATVEAAPAPKADRLARTSDKELTTTAGQAFEAGAVEIKATYQGRFAAGVPVTATLVTDDPDKPVENDQGPYFENPEATGDDKGKPVRTRTGLTTDADGLLKLPKIGTDTHTGTFLLRLTTADGAVLTVELKVTAPDGA